MKSFIQTTVFCVGAFFLILISADWGSNLVGSQMRAWLALASIVLEGLLVRYIVREQVSNYPNQSILKNLLPASLPLIIMVLTVARICGAFGSSIFH